jgi:hypothetical protein
MPAELSPDEMCFIILAASALLALAIGILITE